MIFTLIVGFVAVLLLAFVLHRRLQVAAALAPFLALCGIMLAMVFFGTLNALLPGRIVLYCLILFAAVWEIYQAPKTLAPFLLSPGVIAFVVSGVLLTSIYMVNDSFYYAWDEFSNWGPYYKNVYLSNSFHHFTGLHMAHPAYPQAATGLYYFFVLFAPAFSEAHTYAVLGILLCACASCLLAKASWKHPVVAVAGILCVPVFFVLFPHTEPYITVLLDTVLGAVFGATLLVVLYTSGRSKGQTAAVCLALATLTQTKEIGVLLALICLFFYIVQLLLMQQPQKQGFKQILRQNIKRPFYKHALAATAATLLTTAYWKLFLALTNQPGDQFSDPLAQNFFAKIQAALQGQDEVIAITLERFKINFFHAHVLYNGYGTPFVAGLLFTLTGLVLAVWLIKKKRAFGPAALLITMPLFYLAYLFSLLYTYVCMMSPPEAMNNNSYSRYVGAFFIGWGMLLFGVCLYYAWGFLKRLPSLVPVAACALVLALMANIVPQRDVFNVQLTRAEAGRVGFDEVSRQMSEYLTDEDDIWVIAQGTDALYRYMYHYTLMPARVHTYLPVTVEGISPQRFIEKAQEYDVEYLVVYIVDDAFVETYGELFSDGLAYVQQHALPCLYQLQGNGEPNSLMLRVATVYP